MFDCMNARSLKADKPDRRGYTSPNDERLTVCTYCVVILFIRIEKIYLFSFAVPED